MTSSMQSVIQQRGNVNFPAFLGERIYMQEFTKRGGLPASMKRWQPTIDQMLDGIDVTDEPIFLMVDQGVVKGGETHRRGGMHVDGFWNPAIQAHGSSGGGHGSSPWTPAGHGPKQRNGHSRISMHGSHGDYGLGLEGLVLASDLEACRALEGSYEGEFINGGDMSHLDLSHLKSHTLKANTVYAGTAIGTLHESMPIKHNSRRTLVRLNIQGWEPNA